MKKIVCILLTACLFATAFAVYACAADNNENTAFLVGYACGDKVIKGDVNQDGVRNLKDLLILRKAIAEGTESALVNVDMDGDGKVNLVDVLILRRIFVGAPFWTSF